jgi:hypothetical protein
MQKRKHKRRNGHDSIQKAIPERQLYVQNALLCTNTSSTANNPVSWPVEACLTLHRHLEGKFSPMPRRKLVRIEIACNQTRIKGRVRGKF